MTSVGSTTRPSDARREALKNADAEMGSGRGVPLVSNFFPIERYYSAADKVLESFEEAYLEKRLDDAYVYGKRFAAFSLEALPQHNYYRSPKYTKWRTKNNVDMQNVIVKLEQVATWMDAQEVERQRLYEQQLKLHKQAIEKQKAQERKKMMELQELIHSQQKKKQSTQDSTVANSALNKLQQLNQMFPADKKEESKNKDEATRAERLADYERYSSASLPSNGASAPHESSAASSRSLDVRSDSIQSLSDSMSFMLENGADLPPPIPPPPMAYQEASLGFRVPNANELFPPPPSYSNIMKKNQPPSYNQAVPGSNGGVFPPPDGMPPATSWPLAAPAGGAVVTPDEPPVSFKKRPSRPLPIRKLRDKYTYEYRKLKRERKIEVFGLDTYQGRYHHSTNGCTVISPLVVSQHLRQHNSVSDDAIVHVIDKMCGPILRDIRSKLHLEGDALIIPSDVHDYMVDHKILSQDKFVAANGGNILDDDHLDEFLKMLSSGEKNQHADKKAGAALFFREHVVSIVKVPYAGGSFCYDLVDSLPSLLNSSTNQRMATRTRCKNVMALKSLLKWYACHKFSDSNLAYIDQNAWNECMADFDPRVFQAFVWANV